MKLLPAPSGFHTRVHLHAQTPAHSQMEFGVSIDCPAEGELGSQLTLRLCVTNHTRALHSFRLSFSENDAFLFSGYKLHNFQLPPDFSHSATRGPGAAAAPKLVSRNEGHETRVTKRGSPDASRARGRFWRRASALRIALGRASTWAVLSSTRKDHSTRPNPLYRNAQVQPGAHPAWCRAAAAAAAALHEHQPRAHRHQGAAARLRSTWRRRPHRPTTSLGSPQTGLALAAC